MNACGRAMWKDYIGLIPVGIAVLNGILAVVVAQFPLQTAQHRVMFVAIVSSTAFWRSSSRSSRCKQRSIG